MSRGIWNKVKKSKFFYVKIYRRLLLFIIIFQIINVALFLSICYVYLNRPERVYYATSGITLPIQLTALERPNYSSEALLPPDPVLTEAPKTMPE
jgi:intracellular multiplication protein IcmM